jgi:predicted CXXCH cytochrome family protein
LAAAQDDCTAAQCHARLIEKGNVHPAAFTCESCHESTSTPHPKKGEQTFKLTSDPPELCSACHEAFGEKGHVHFPVEQGMCTTCHDPHASDESALLAQPMLELCGSCHADHVEFEVPHGPVSAGDCTACHAPHESDNAALLVAKSEALCATCHVDMQDLSQKKNVHPALLGGCTSCHDPHGSAHPKLLAEEGQQVCFLCHPDIGETVAESPVSHVPVQMDNGCPSCHSPHASDNDSLLLHPQREVCLACHEEVVTENMTVLHGPNNDGKCSGCHHPHGSQHAKLLVDMFPEEIYVPYTESAFALCFSCHNRDLLRYPDTSFATNFRDGEKNLHFVHVNDKEKGRSCKLCHNVHGSSDAKLIAESVPFGKWNLPLKFVKTETGGGCSPGCHRPAFYDRESPGRKPPKEGT